MRKWGIAPIPKGSFSGYKWYVDISLVTIITYWIKMWLKLCFGARVQNCINNHLFEKGQNQLNQTKATFGSKKCEFYFFLQKNNNAVLDTTTSNRGDTTWTIFWTHVWWSFLVKTPFLNLAGAQDLQVLEVLGEIHGGGQVEDNMLVAWGKSQGGFFWGGWFSGIRWAPYKL